MRCADFYKRWEKDPNWCEKTPGAVSQINSYLELVGEIETRGIDREIIYAKFPEGAARPILAIKDGEIRVKVLNFVCASLKRSERIYPTELKNLVNQYEGKSKLEKFTNVNKVTPVPEVKTEIHYYKPTAPINIGERIRAQEMAAAGQNQPFKCTGQFCNSEKIKLEDVRGKVCILVGTPCNQVSKCELEERRKKAASLGFTTALDDAVPIKELGPVKIVKTPMSDAEKKVLADAFVERAGRTAKEIQQIDALVAAGYERITSRYELIEKAVSWFLAQAEGE